MPPIRKNYQSASDERTNKNHLSLPASSSSTTTGNRGLIDAPIVRSHGMHMAAPYRRVPPFNAGQRQQYSADLNYQSTPPPPPPQQDAVYRQYQQSQQGFCNPQQGAWAGYQTASVQQHTPAGYAAGASATVGAYQGNGTRGVYASASAFEYTPSTLASLAPAVSASTSTSTYTSAPSPSSSPSSPPSPSAILADYDLSSYPAPAGTLNPAHLFLPLDQIPSLRHTAPQNAPQPQPQPRHQHQTKANATQSFNQRRQPASVDAISINNANMGMGMGTGKGKGIGIRVGSTVRYAPLVPSAQMNVPSRLRPQAPKAINAAPGIGIGIGRAHPYMSSVSYAPSNGAMNSAGPSSLRQSNFASTQPVAMVPSVSKSAQLARNRDRAPSPVQSGFIEDVDSDDESESDDTQSSSDGYPETHGSVSHMPHLRDGYAPRPASSQTSGGAERYSQASQNNHFDLLNQEEVRTQHDLSNSSGAGKRKRSPPAGRKDHSTPSTTSSKQEPLQHTFKFVDHFAEVHERRLRSADAGHPDDEGERAPKRRRSGSPVASPGQRQFVMMDGITRKKRAPNGTNPTRTQPTQARTSNPEPKSKHSLQPVPPPASPARLASQPAENVQQPTLEDEHKVEEVAASSHRTTDDAFLALLEYNNSVVLTAPLEDEYKAALSRIREKEKKRLEEARKRREGEART